MSPRVLVVAGHDSSGGAGVDADRETCERFEVEVDLVCTVRTEQAGGRVLRISRLDPAGWLEAARMAVTRSPDALKSGLLPGADHVRAFGQLVELVRERDPDLPVVVDPVLAASGGEVFLAEAGIGVLRDELSPRGVVLTPNLPEAARLTGCAEAELADDRDARVAAANELLRWGARAVVLKGGHGREDLAADLVLEAGSDPVWIERPRVRGPSLHGSGCRHASALAAGLALGRTLAEAAAEAGRFVARAIERGAR